jgi:membrane fusion protein (multidrug efflux system)
VKGLVIAAVIAAALAYGVKYYIHSLGHESTDDAFIEAHVIRVSPRVAGHVRAVLFRENERVEKGALLVELDPRDFQARLDQARAALAAAKANAGAARSNLAGAREAVRAAEANVAFARAEESSAAADVTRTAEDLARYRALVARGSLAEQRLDHAVAEARTAQSRLDAARTRMASAEASLAGARETVIAREAAIASADAAADEAEAAARWAELQLSYTRIYAPEAGRATRKSVEPGDYVEVGQALVAIVVPEVWVVANFKETQVGRMRPGNPVAIRIDAYPDVTFRGHVESIQRGTGARFSLLPPENATGNYVKVVQRVPVKILFDEQPADRYLVGPGMSVEPEVAIGEASAPPPAGAPAPTATAAGAP